MKKLHFSHSASEIIDDESSVPSDGDIQLTGYNTASRFSWISWRVGIVIWMNYVYVSFCVGEEVIYDNINTRK
jgi:hypothetical protein